jgi:hypothetical protein
MQRNRITRPITGVIRAYDGVFYGYKIWLQKICDYKTMLILWLQRRSDDACSQQKTTTRQAAVNNS